VHEYATATAEQVHESASAATARSYLCVGLALEKLERATTSAAA
jgi:hypothetical protein